MITLKGRSGVKVKSRRSVWVARPHRELQNKEPTTLNARFSMLSLMRQQAQGKQASSRAALLVQKRGVQERADREQVRFHVPSQRQLRAASISHISLLSVAAEATQRPATQEEPASKS